MIQGVFTSKHHFMFELVPNEIRLIVSKPVYRKTETNTTCLFCGTMYLQVKDEILECSTSFTSRPLLLDQAYVEPSELVDTDDPFVTPLPTFRTEFGDLDRTRVNHWAYDANTRKLQLQIHNQMTYENYLLVFRPIAGLFL